MSERQTGETAVPRRRAAPRRPVAALPAVVVVLAGVLVVALVEWTTPAGSERVGTSRVGLEELTQVCLADGPRGGLPVTTHTTVGVALPGLSESGTVSAAPVERSGGAGGVQVPASRGRLEQFGASTPRDSVRLVSDGPAAAARATHRVDSGPGSLAAQECASPRTGWWFTGAGAGLDHSSVVVLANVDEGPAVVDIRFYGPDGVIPSVGTRGMSLAPGEVRTVDLVDVAPQTDEVTVHVETSRGRVAAAVSDTYATAPGAAPGKDWLPAQHEPARRLRLGALPVEADARTLVVSNPSSREALVEVAVAGEGGTFAPAEGALVSVPPGTVLGVDVTAAVGEDHSAFVLTTPVPVTATLRSSLDGEVSYAAALPWLSGPAVAPGMRGGSLQLTAGPRGAKATATAFDEGGGEVSSTDLTLDPGATTAWAVPRRAAYVVVDPGRGRVVGGVVSDGKQGLAQVALTALVVSLTRPAVAPVVRPPGGAFAPPSGRLSQRED